MSIKKLLNIFKPTKNLQKSAVMGNLILILGPSGTGKGTVINHLKATFPDLVFPASCTTRDMRPNEVEGDVYHFITKEEFTAKIDKGDFLEWANVHGDNYYGTDKAAILDNLESNKNVLREVDIQGVHSLQKLIPKNKIHTIFITTQPWEKLEARIKNRANISPEELAKRKESYLQEIKYINEMDYVLQSEDNKIEECNSEAVKIVQSIINS
jgi:guanylate kinase